MDDDFLWDCALHTQSSSRIDIIPDYEDDMRHFCHDNLNKASIGTTFKLTPMHTHDPSEAINISITESRGNGVLDIIGGELWEGALLLCIYILQNQHAFLTRDVLELGSGVGLPGLLLAQLKANHVTLQQKVGDVTLTDNDPRVVANLNSSVSALHVKVSPASDQSTDDIVPLTRDSGLNLHTKILDWSVFAAQNVQNIHCDTSSNKTTSTTQTSTSHYIGDHTTLPPAASEVSPICEVIMGCELCYAPYHAQCLAELLRYYLHHGYCKKVVICQMRDREGFAELLSRLQAMCIVYTLHEVTEEQYVLAQSIQCCKVVGNSGSSGATADSSMVSRARADSEENNDIISKMFIFPALIHNRESGHQIDGVGGVSSSNLLHSSKENFVFLTIG